MSGLQIGLEFKQNRQRNELAKAELGQQAQEIQQRGQRLQIEGQVLQGGHMNNDNCDATPNNVRLSWLPVLQRAG